MIVLPWPLQAKISSYAPVDGVILHLVMVNPIYIKGNKVWQEINRLKPLEESRWRSIGDFNQTL